jgi:hypothetical protein
MRMQTCGRFAKAAVWGKGAAICNAAIYARNTNSEKIVAICRWSFPFRFISVIINEFGCSLRECVVVVRNGSRSREQKLTAMSLAFSFNVKVKRAKMRILQICLLVGLTTAQTAQAGTVTYFTPPGSSTTDGSVHAEADFTTYNGGVRVTLVNFLQNPKADGQLISALTFDVIGAHGSGTLATTNNGSISNVLAEVDSGKGKNKTIVSPNGKYSAGVSDPLTHWKATETGDSINLTTLTGGKPYDLIIGPDSIGGFTGSGLYSNANPSIIQHNPVVLGSATFDIAIAGVTTDSFLTNVVFQFGTQPGSDLVNGMHSPEPSTIVVWSVLAGVFGVGKLRGRRKKSTTAA